MACVAWHFHESSCIPIGNNYYILYCFLFHWTLVELTNEQSLDMVESAQFIVCLDQSNPHTSQLQFTGYDTIQDYQKSILANRVLHGNGSKQNSSNRWFDTAVQVKCLVIVQ